MQNSEEGLFFIPLFLFFNLDHEITHKPLRGLRGHGAEPHNFHKKSEAKEMKRVNMGIKGDVQMAGFRTFINLMRSFDKKGEVMIGILSSMNGTMNSMNGTMNSMNVTMKSVKEDTSKMLEKQDDTIGEIRSLREDLKSDMENKFGKIEHEIEAIKAKIGMT